MAFGICNPSLRPFILPHGPTAVKEEAQGQASLVNRISGQAAPRPAMKLSRPNNMICFDITMGCCQNLSMPLRYLCVSVAGWNTLDSDMHVTMSGYWMGPDIEDGWGFVEAAVDRRI
ncbi:hypothetical protein COCNU_04G009450 [Cocos nucifera]|uniref:Uncharacterized protein n=1 Tax=Cocos nucifera TaxID=13894 RepID=A0A8K0I766_COCNU|nr:hypothetical protein COCNU_04G009450 [Cocos nucifera]